MEYKMAYIYKITNVINGKSYIGKTQLTLEKRFKQHLSDSKKESYKHRPLYRAINKYGVENFTITELEETNIPEEREIYWIEFYNSYGNTGYNATKGGDGKPYVNENLVIYYLNNITVNCNEISKLLNYDHSTILRIARKHNLYVKYSNKPYLATKEITEKVLSLYVPGKGKNSFGRRKIAKLLNIELSLVGSILISDKRSINSEVE